MMVLVNGQNTRIKMFSFNFYFTKYVIVFTKETLWENKY